ncbi:hypothetical protein NM208_g8280 [Fusarium decemcellulare]|uniref:Uncharacterized protein n=1 Tax=Fusarium decemcellulare TaxID=57161 RepID=A0ACC1S625_9HYPO|nr:hypothetical protein NM208_g8280 [Fusarium decemcellulare]
MGQPQTHRTTTTALASPGPATSRDVHFYDTNVTSSSIPSLPSSSSASRGMLQELSADQVHNTSLAWNSPHRSQESQHLIALQDSKIVSLFKPKTSSSRANRRRPGVDSDSFEPLDAVLEESSIASASSIAATFGSRSSGSQDISPKAKPAEIHPLITAKPASSARQQYENHLAGQFEWVLSCPAPASDANDHGFPNDVKNDRRNNGTKVYGCNLLSREQRSAPSDAPTQTPLADTFTLLATLLEPGEYSYLGLDFSQILSDNAKMSLAPPPAYEFHQTTPRKVPEVVEVVEQAVSPSLTLISERSSSYAGSSRNGSFSVPRIEDSLEELDKLEDELEAINAVTQPRRIGPLEAAPSSTKHLEPPSTIKKSSISKRASIAGMSATVRVKPSERPQPSIRRSTSLVFRDKKQDEPESTPQLRSRASRGKLPTFQPMPPKAPIKSTKPPTVPNFELPGEAVARRLKEQRQARLAQQTDAQKAYVPPPRPKSSKPPTKPSFELPGEAISRRKREEREARLKAQEEEERKKREFKARPVRTSITPSTIPRETITSLARQGKLPQEDDATKQPDVKSKRLSVAGARPVPTSEIKPSQNRGRLSTATSREDLSRGTSTSGGSASGKRTTLTAEEAHQLRLRGKEIFQRDNSSFTRDREREKREREAAARTAREQAAERSRIASREWAEKKRRKEQALLKAAMG